MTASCRKSSLRCKRVLRAKSAAGAFYVYLVFLLGYLPQYSTVPVQNGLGISQFSVKPCYLLVEDVTHSTHSVCEIYFQATTKKSLGE